MTRWIRSLRSYQLSRPAWATPQMLHNLNLLALAVGFVILSTAILSVDSILTGGNGLADLRIGSVVEEDIRAPRSLTYVSRALTERARDCARRLGLEFERRQTGYGDLQATLAQWAKRPPKGE